MTSDSSSGPIGQAAGSTLIRGGVIVDGTGAPRRIGDVLISGDRIVQVGDIDLALHDTGTTDAEIDVIDADGLVVAPGFINILSHAYAGLQQDPRGASNILQGVTTEIFGEGISGGPVTGHMGEHWPLDGPDKDVRLFWPTLGAFLDHYEHNGVGPNVASLVGFSNLRLAVAGYEDRPVTPDEIETMAKLLATELADGALGLGSALIYPPECYSATEELVRLGHVLREHDAVYATHLRSENHEHLDAIDELLEIVHTTGVRAEIYHLKSLGEKNWPQLPTVLDMLEEARAAGAEITADIYPYAAAGTSIQTVIPQEFLAGGQPALIERLHDPATRSTIREQMIAGTGPSMFADAGGAGGMMLLDHSIRYDNVAGRFVTDIAADLDEDPIEVILNIVETDPLLLTAYFSATEINTRMVYARPWVSVGSDAQSIPAEPPFVSTPVHPRAYGTFARVLGTYVRDEGIVTLEDGIRKMTSQPANTLGLRDRGRIAPGAMADLAVFDLHNVRDHATYDAPHQYATGMVHVFVNGIDVLRDGVFTGRLGGRALRRGR